MGNGQKRLLGFCHLYESCIILVEEDFDTLDISLDTKKDEEVITFSQFFIQVGHQ
jgi:hypothetical protein